MLQNFQMNYKKINWLGDSLKQTDSDLNPSSGPSNFQAYNFHPALERTENSGIVLVVGVIWCLLWLRLLFEHAPFNAHLHVHFALASGDQSQQVHGGAERLTPLIVDTWLVLIRQHRPGESQSSLHAILLLFHLQKKNF
jgi:hypothetical protein